MDGNHKTIGETIQEILLGFQNMVKSEVRLFQAEIHQTVKDTGRHTAFLIGFGMLATIGILPFIAFLVIGLGVLLGENYWLSSLIVSLGCMGAGGTLGYFYARKISQQDFSLPHSRASLKVESQIVRDKIQEVADTVQRRAS